MQKDIFERVISFLLGASWAFVFFGALLTFKVFLTLGLGLSLFLTIVFIIVSLFMVVMLDSFIVNKQRLVEAKKQTKILEKLYSQKEKQLS